MERDLTHSEKLEKAILRIRDSVLRDQKEMIQSPSNRRLAVTIEKIREAVSAERESTAQVADAVRKAIQSIGQAIIRNWRDEELASAERALARLQVGIPTPTLAVCGFGTQEVRFTKYLAYFLDPTKSHGVGDEFLHAALGQYAKALGLPMNWRSQAHVEAEVKIGEIRRNGATKACICDVVVEDASAGWAILIEEKILSAEGRQGDDLQLEDYSNALSANPQYRDRRLQKIFLTPYKRKPSDDSWVPVEHREFVEAGIRVLSDSSLHPVARANLVRFLMDLAVGPYYRTEEAISVLTGLLRRVVQLPRPQPVLIAQVKRRLSDLELVLRITEKEVS